MTTAQEVKGEQMAELPKDMIFHYYSEDGITIKVDAIPVVRCGECKWLVKSEMVCKLLSNNYEPPVMVESDDYCSRGKRREDG